MAIHHVDLDDFFKPRSNNEDILLSVEYGDGQKGAFTVFRGDDQIVPEEPDDDEDNVVVNLGKKKDIGSLDILISVVIRDTSHSTNWTSMTVVLNQGSHETRYGPYRVKAENHLDTIVYTLKLSN